MSVTDDYIEDVENNFPGSNGSTNPSMEEDDGFDGLEDFEDLGGNQEGDELESGLSDIGGSEGEDEFDDAEQQ